MKTLDQRLEEARELRKAGYNCAQCVTMVFDDITDEYIDRDLFASIIGGFGGGVGGMKEVCGTVSAAAAIESLLNFHAPTDKARAYSYIQTIAEEFRAENGSLVCRELKTVHRKPCMKLIEDSIALLHKKITLE